MSATSIGTIVKDSIGWSIGLSVLMIVAGLLAILVPPAAGVAVVFLVAWMLVVSGGAHLVFAWYTRTTGGMIWELLLGIAYLLVCGRHLGTGLRVSASSDGWFELATVRWRHHSDPGDYDLEDMAIEHGMGDRNAGWDQHAFQRRDAIDALFGGAPSGGQTGLREQRTFFGARLAETECNFEA
jgi:hypothetical protein